MQQRLHHQRQHVRLLARRSDVCAEGGHDECVARGASAARPPARGRGIVTGLLVNRWGEIWVEREDRVIGVSHDGSLVKQTDKVHESPPDDDPIPLSAIDTRAIDRARRAIAARLPGEPFVKATLERDDFLYNGLRWELQVGSDSHHFYATFAASPDGREICELVRFDHGKTTTPKRCPKYEHQPKHLPPAP
jgi:hypothetical protein